jgi:hypothetical protein
MQCWPAPASGSQRLRPHQKERRSSQAHRQDGGEGQFLMINHCSRQTGNESERYKIYFEVDIECHIVVSDFLNKSFLAFICQGLLINTKTRNAEGCKLYSD